MKNIFYALVFALGAFAYADQTVPPQQKPEVVEFNTYFNVFVCTKVQNSQDYNCDAANVSAEKASVKLEKSADHQGLMMGTLSLDKEVQQYRHMAEVKVMKHAAEEGTHYGFHIEETFYKASQQMPDSLDHTYGAVHMKSPADLNEVTFYGRILRAGDQLFIPVLILGPSSATTQQRLMKIDPLMF